MFPYYSPAQQNYVSPYCGNAFVGRSLTFMDKEPIDYLIGYIYWVLMFPMAITEKSNNKKVRAWGTVLTIPFALLTWIISGLPFLLLVIILGIAQLWKDA